MNFHQHSTNNMLLKPPEGMLDCKSLPATMTNEDSQIIISSFWRPTPEELMTIMAGGSIVLHVFGHMHPPVAIGAVPRE